MAAKKHGFMTHLFLSETELDNLAHWRYKVVDSSISTRYVRRTPVHFAS